MSVSEFIGKVTAQKAILDALKGGMLTVKEIAEHTGLKPNAIRSECGRLKAQDKVVKVDDKWGLRDYRYEENQQADMPFG